MIKVDVEKRTVGINFDGDEAEVCVWAPHVEKVEVKLSKNNSLISLHRADYGYWQVSTKEITPGDLYKFRLDENKELPDPASLSQPGGVHGSSQAVDLKDHRWQDNNWRNLPLDEYIIYELHSGTFTPEGTFSSLEEKLDHLKELGINAIEIMPVAQFPGSRNWGYDGVYPFAVQNSYGGIRELQLLVDQCHSRGIAVILDVVYNHLGPEGNYFNEYGPYFTDKYNTPWGNAINFDDEWSDAVRQYYIENALMWFRDFHIDALRLDAVHAIKDFSPTHLLRELKAHVDQLCKVTGKKHHLIVELDLNDNRFINPMEKEGYGMDAQWIDEFHHALRITAGGDRSGYYSDFEGIRHLAKAYKDAYVYDGIYSDHRKKTFGIRTDNPGRQFIVFSQNHDQVGNRMLGERTSQLVSFEMQKLLAGAVFVSPYLPMLFMGEEWGEPNPFLYFVSHTDPELAEAVRQGRKEEFAAFHAEGEAPDPMAQETFENSKLQWELISREPHSKLFNYYKALISLRKTQPTLYNLNRDQLDVQYNEGQNTLILSRWHDEQKLICLMNFSGSSQTFLLPSSSNQWDKIFDSADPVWNGTSTAPETIDAGSEIAIQPESFIIYSNTYA
jgi:maltooligosyltrehalose trehalohydrolase